MNKILVKGGTSNFSEPSLCITCRRSTMIKGDTLNDSVVFCNAVDARITFEVRDCNSYEDKRQPSIYDMKEAAWVLRTDAHRKKIGFVPYRKLEKEEQRELDAKLDSFE